MHKLLRRQLKKLSLKDELRPTQEQWNLFKSRINESYEASDQDRYTLERSLKISSDELKYFYNKQKQSLEARQQSILNAMPDLLFLLDEEGRYIDILANDESDLLYETKRQLMGKTIHDVLPKESVEHFMQAIGLALKTGELQKLNYRLDVGKGVVDFEGRVVITGQTENGKRTVLFLARDVSDIVDAKNKLKHQATHDVLTGLSNRAAFNQHFEQALARAKRSNNKGALLFLDLDDFKSVNDSLGHSAGDEMLVEIASRLSGLCRAVDTVARFGGDEFVIILEDTNNKDHLISFLNKLLQQFEQKIMLHGYALEISTSVGVTVFPDNGNEMEQLIKQADTAMYAAKKAGKNGFHFFTQELLDENFAGFTLDIELREAVEKNEFFLMYQPQYSLASQDISGFEALIRWQHPVKGLILPTQFIPTAETTGLIDHIGLWVFSQVCEQVVTWSQSNLPFKQIAFNISRRQLVDKDFYAKLAAILKETNAIDYIDKIECEITESVLLTDTDTAYKNLVALSELGMRLSIDDFGTGHSSLIDLKRFPLTGLKIDQAFVADIGKESHGEAIIEASIALAKSFNLEVVAEGVETKAQEQFLKSAQCKYVQGYLYSLPLNVEAAEQLLKSIKRHN